MSLISYMKLESETYPKILALNEYITLTWMLLTLDISLHTNICHEAGLETLSFYLQYRNSTCYPPNQLIINFFYLLRNAIISALKKNSVCRFQVRARALFVNLIMQFFCCCFFKETLSSILSRTHICLRLQNCIDS